MAIGKMNYKTKSKILKLTLNPVGRNSGQLALSQPVLDDCHHKILDDLSPKVLTKSPNFLLKKVQLLIFNLSLLPTNVEIF